MTRGTNPSPANESLGTDSLKPVASTPSLHVLTLTPFFPFAENPVYGTYISEPIERFAAFGLRSSVIGVSALHRPRRRPLPGVEAEWLRYPQVPGKLGLSSAGAFLYWRLLPYIRRLNQQCAIDIIHAHSALPCGHAAASLAEALRVPFVVTIHGLDTFNACDAPGTRAARWRAKISAGVYRRARSVICVSSAIQSRLKDGMQQPFSSHVVYNGADPQMFFPEDTATSAQVPCLLMVGNLLRSKGHEIVLQAMAKAAERFPDLQCKVIGEGPDRQLFDDLARELGISERVTFLGRQGRQSVAKAMRECTIFALPSRSEGLGCAYLEAMACGKPVIACEGQGIGEIIEHGRNGWLIPVDSVHGMAEALSRLLDSPDLRTSMGANARQTIINGLTITDQVRRLNDAYRDAARLQSR